MLRKGMLIAVALSVCAGVSAQAQPAEDFQWWRSCEELKAACKEASAEDLWWAASIDEHPGPPYPFGDGPILGTCYTHDKRSCPNCLCSDYVKLSYLGGQKGYDGDRGCMTDRAAAAAKLKELCEAGACCCPQVEPKPCHVPTPVKARDPLTGSCCTFPNICSAPSDWEKPIAPHDARCDPSH
ncbi:MAG TPA: hypothetical protein VEL74_23600 [Thermoanaerobaculia bacterium]|nr:hypothetical protein [Thermoanaerobaculia bacterium]